MPLHSYGVLKGIALGRKLGQGSTPHYQVHVLGGALQYRVAVNVKSKASPSELLYTVVEDFQHPLLDDLPALDDGFHELASEPGGMAVDFIRGNHFEPCDMFALPFAVPGPDNDLNERVDNVVQRAIGDEEARVYAFGERWGPEPGQPDKHFGFEPGNGVHDVHMNQGNVHPWVGDDGPWQDGALLIHLPGEGAPGGGGRWVGVFLAFQSQAWHTDDQTGHAIGAHGPGSRGCDVPDDDVDVIAAVSKARIVAALPNPVGGHPEDETVTIVNAAPTPLDLTGWSLADKQKTKHPLEGTIEPGDAARVRTAQPFALSNKGGTITLLDPAGLKVHGVSYTKAQAKNEGWTVVFGE